MKLFFADINAREFVENLRPGDGGTNLDSEKKIGKIPLLINGKRNQTNDFKGWWGRNNAWFYDAPAEPMIWFQEQGVNAVKLLWDSSLVHGMIRTWFWFFNLILNSTAVMGGKDAELTLETPPLVMWSLANEWCKTIYFGGADRQTFTSNYHCKATEQK